MHDEPRRSRARLASGPGLVLLASSLALPLAWACDAGADSRFTTDVLPGGMVRATNTGAPAWTPRTAWRLEEDLRLGTVNGEGPEQFGRIGAIMSDSSGIIYVLETFAQEIRVFHPTGEFSHTIGTKGEGPGEFMGATGMALGPGDTLWVVDPQMTRRYSAFDRDGTFLTSYPRRVREYALTGRFTPAGRFVDWGLAFPDERPGVVAGSRVVFQPVRLSEGWRVADSLPPIEYDQPMVADGTRPQIFFDAELAVHQDRNGRIWFAHTGEYRIFGRDLDGDTMLVFTLPAQPAPVGEAEKAEVRARFASRPELARDYLDALPRTKPVIHRMVGDDAGHLFVVPELAGVPAGTVVDVFRTSGEYIGRLDLPTPMSVPASGAVVHATRDHLYYVAADEHDVPFLSRVRIHGRG